MPSPLQSTESWKKKCLTDGEFQMATRHWNGGIRLKIGSEERELFLVDGNISEINENPGGMIEISGSDLVWAKVLSANPKRFYNDIIANISQRCGLRRKADAVVFAQYYSAVMRSIELLRPFSASPAVMRHDNRPHGTIDAPIGRYVHLNLDGKDHRVYFEEAGQGIPLLLQHTAGCHSSQWRHLFEFPEITKRFRLIAYDLPYHGKSIPPSGLTWWNDQYLLKEDFLRSIPVKLTETLGLVNPVFMGCSVGGLLALDLAHKHPDVFRAVISIEGALKIGGNLSDYGELHHPQVSNEYKARLMEGLMSPLSPEQYRKEISFSYSSGWPSLFLGDLHYYVEDYDLRKKAAEIDTNVVGVHILSGEYDYSATAELGKGVHEAIPGSTWREMKGVGHFPMSENPQLFREYLLPVLDKIINEGSSK
jgi:pimeloyl-ACP methyl ester carboxylesterase